MLIHDAVPLGVSLGAAELRRFFPPLACVVSLFAVLPTPPPRGLFGATDFRLFIVAPFGEAEPTPPAALLPRLVPRGLLVCARPRVFATTFKAQPVGLKHQLPATSSTVCGGAR